MKILLSGGTGFVGKALTAELLLRDHQILILTRQHLQNTRAIQYVSLPASGELLPVDVLQQVDAIINLAGQNIGAQRWSDSVKREILHSRVEITHQLVDSIRQCQEQAGRGPQCLISASAAGYYGTAAQDVFTEASPPGRGFLADVCRQWEAAASRAKEIGVRTSILRFGHVLGQGGLAARLAQPLSVGIAGILGDGKQYLPWIHMEDLVRIIMRPLTDENMNGVYNACSYPAVTMNEFVQALRTAVGGISIPVHVPGWLLRKVFGEMADEILLTGQQVVPQRLQQLGFRFRYTNISSALTDIYR